MNIIELCRSPGRGGLELYMCRSVEALRERHRMTAVVNGREGLIRERLRELGFSYQSVGGSYGPLPLLAAWRLAKLIDREAIQALHVHWRGDLPLAAIGKWLSRRKPKLLYSRQMRVSRGKNDPYHNFIYGQVDLFLAISRQLQQDFREKLHPRHRGKVKLLYYGTEPPKPLDGRERERLREKYRIPKNRFVIALFGQVYEAKGHHLLMAALGELRAAGIPFKALVVGRCHDTAFLSRLRAMAEALRISEQLEFVDFLRTPQHLMQLCDVVVLPSLEETFGLVLIEAMSVGTAVVGSNSGGVPEIIEDGRNGLLFEAGDASDFSKKLADLYRDPERRKAMGAAAAQIAAERFSNRNHYEALEAFMAP